MTRILEQILEAKRAEVATLAAGPTRSTPTKDVVRALSRAAPAPVRLIAEFKRKSPSAGALVTDGTRAGERAKQYVAGGASMISVLTDHRFFGGSFADLEEVRTAVDVPLLAKEFVIDEKQILRARSAGADAILLIVRIVPRDRLLALAAEARRVGLEPFVEVVDEDEVAIALAASARVIGVNARDLDTLQMDAVRTARVLAVIPDDVVGVHLSGLKSAADVAAVSSSRARAALIGEALMRAADPAAMIRELVGQAAPKG